MVLDNKKHFLVDSQIISDSETVEDMIERVSNEVYKHNSNTKLDVSNEKDKFENYFKEGMIIPGTPILRNAGRNKKPLSACSVPKIPQNISRKELEKIVNEHHINGMGTGFNFDQDSNPISKLLLLNQISLSEIENDLLDRTVANMGILSVSHPMIKDFIKVKSDLYSDIDWKFNVSINIDDEFMRNLATSKPYKLKNDFEVDPKEIYDSIGEATHQCGDPGIIFLDRLNASNVTPHLGEYISVAPCGEMPMSEGDACQFGYINLANFCSGDSIDYEELARATQVMTNFLDSSLELSIKKTSDEFSRNLLEQKRKIGVGVCGYSDLLFQLGIPYGSAESIRIAENIMSLINYESKKTSIEMAKAAGTFKAFKDDATRVDNILGNYLNHSTDTVTPSDWNKLNADLLEYGIRNSTTIALPPTGRSSYILNTSASIEPAFRLSTDGKFADVISKYINHLPKEEQKDIIDTVNKYGTIKDTTLSIDTKKKFATCLEIDSDSHLNVLGAFQKFTDDSIAKTINLPHECSPSDILNIYTKAYNMGIKGITVYRNDSIKQPKKLGGSL